MAEQGARTKRRVLRVVLSVVTAVLIVAFMALTGCMNAWGGSTTVSSGPAAVDQQTHATRSTAPDGSATGADTTSSTTSSTSVPASTPAWSLVPLTVNYLNDETPGIDGNLVVWRASDGNDTEIMLRDLASGAVRQLTDNSEPDDWPQVSGNQVAWESAGAVGLSLHVLDLDTGARRDLGALKDHASFDLQGGLLTWVGGPPQASGVFVHTIATGTTRQVQGLEHSQFDLRTDGRYVGILGFSPRDSRTSTLEVFLYAAETDQLRHVAGPVLTNASLPGPGLGWLEDGRLVWSQSDGHDEEIYLYDAASGKTQRLTDNQEDDYESAVGGGRVLWHTTPVRSTTTITASAPNEVVPTMPPMPVGTTGEPRHVVVYDLATGTSRDLGDGYGRLQVDGKVAAVVAPLNPGARVALVDLDTGASSSFEVPASDGAPVQLSGGRAVWSQRSDLIYVDSAEVVLASQPPAPAAAAAPTPPGVAFADVALSPYRAAIEELGRWGIARSDGAGEPATFGPDAPVLRGDLAVMIRLAAGLSLDQVPAVSPFGDSGGSKDAIGQAVDALYAAGVVQAADLYRPRQLATREQVVSMVVRAAQAVAPSSLVYPPADYSGSLDPGSGPHLDSLRLAEFNHLLAGLQGFGPTWDPSGPATRGETAQLVAWLLAAKLGAR